MRPWLAVLASATLGAGVQSCSAPDPDGELRALVAAAENAAEERDTGFFRDVLSASYVDRRGQRRDDVINLIRGFFLVNATIEVVNRIDEIELAGDDAATVVLQTAVVGRAPGRALSGIDAELKRIELELVKEDDEWRVIAADWTDLGE
jgi:hypothetical protein